VAIVGRTKIIDDQVDLSFIHGDGSGMSLKTGDVVVNRSEPKVLYEIVSIRWACPPDEGGIADLKFWGAHPHLSKVTRAKLLARDLKNDVFGAFLKDLTAPENVMEAIAISAQEWGWET